MALNDATNSFRQDIEGLRAFAVLAVIVFHLHLNGLLRGGFLGVDVFFVVSGYLIGRQAHGEILAGTFSFVRFLRRRILRIAPALLAMLAVSGVVGYWVLLPSEFSTLGYSAAMAAIGLSNEYFRTTADYFDQASKSNPLLHTWSLGVEEQFYFILPLLLMIAARVSGRSPIVTALACAVLGTISFFGSWCLAASDWDGMAFYSVASRGWQLLLGVWIGTANLRGVESYRNRTIIAAIGLFAILVAFVLFDSSLTLPAPYGLVVCAGTAALLWVHEAGGSPIHWILSQPLIRYVGRISYSLYVWHWPVFVFGGMLLGDGRNVAEKLVVKCSFLAVTGLAGCVSYHLVEMPLRHWRGSMALVFSIWALVVSAVVLLGAWIGWSEGFPARFDAEVAALDEFRSFKDRGFMREDSCFLSSKMPEPSNFKSAECLKRSASAQNVILFGDSHAAHLWTGLSKAMPELNVMQVTAASCKPLLVADVGRRSSAVSNPAGICLRRGLDRYRGRYPFWILARPRRRPVGPGGLTPEGKGR